jgi:hypothetical protein
LSIGLRISRRRPEYRDLGLSALDRGAGREPAENHNIRVGAPRFAQRIRPERYPDLVIQWECEVFRHDADHNMVHTAKLNRLPEGCTVACEAGLPDVVTDHRDWSRAIAPMDPLERGRVKTIGYRRFSY